MSTVRDVSKFLEKQIREGRGDWQVAICRRGLTLRDQLELHPGDKYAALDPRKKLVYLTARIKEH